MIMKLFKLRILIQKNNEFSMMLTFSETLVSIIRRVDILVFDRIYQQRLLILMLNKKYN